MGDSGCFAGDGSAGGTNNQGAVRAPGPERGPHRQGSTAGSVAPRRPGCGRTAHRRSSPPGPGTAGTSLGATTWPGGSSGALCLHRTTSTGLESEDIPPCYPGDTRALSPRSAPSTLDFPLTNTTACPYIGPRARPPQWAPASSVSRQPRTADPQHPCATGRNTRSLTPRPRQECAPGHTGLPCWEGR